MQTVIRCRYIYAVQLNQRGIKKIKTKIYYLGLALFLTMSV